MAIQDASRQMEIQNLNANPDGNEEACGKSVPDVAAATILGVSSQKISTISEKTMDARRLTISPVLLRRIGGNHIGDRLAAEISETVTPKRMTPRRRSGLATIRLDRFGLFVSRLRLVFETEPVYGHESGLGSEKKYREGQKETRRTM